MVGKSRIISWTPLHNRLKIVHIHIEGPSYHWFQWLRIRSRIWHGIGSRRVDQALRGRKSANPFVLLSSLKQYNQQVDAYIEQVEVLLVRVDDLLENQCLGYFLCGLRKDISRRIGIHEPRTIMKVMDIARVIEEEMIGYQGVHRSWYSAVS